MATVQIPWNNGEGYISAVYTGDGSGPLRFSSTTANNGLDRSQTVQVASGRSPLEVEVTVTQTGSRELFCTAGTGNPPFNTAENSPFAVLKQDFSH